MKSVNFIFLITVLILSGCKSKQNISSNIVTEQKSEDPKIVGKVSHQYQATGCATVIITNLPNAKSPSVLIPKDQLAKEFDVDGMEISFNYHPLKMPNPKGCQVGIPVLLTNIKRE